MWKKALAIYALGISSEQAADGIDEIHSVERDLDIVLTNGHQVEIRKGDAMSLEHTGIVAVHDSSVDKVFLFAMDQIASISVLE